MLRREPSSDGRKGNPHEKAAHQVERNVWVFLPEMNTSKALFSTQERSLNSAWNHFVVTRRLDMGAVAPVTLFDLHTDIFRVPDPFFVDPCTNNFGLKI